MGYYKRLVKKIFSKKGKERFLIHWNKASYFSWKYMLWSFGHEFALKFGQYNKCARYFNNKKNRYIDTYFAEKYQYIFDRYNIIDKYNPQSVGNFRIWFIWWQGIDKAPRVIKNNYRLLKKFNGDIIQIVNQYNYKEFVDIPEYIIDKVNRKVITITHLSDILRASLLARHGGFYIDATTLVCKPIPNEEKKFPIISRIHEAVPTSGVFHQNRYSGWCIGTPYIDYPLFCFARDMLFAYWKKENMLIDYLLIDKVMTWGIDRIPVVSKDYALIPSSNEDAYMLIDKMDVAFNEEQFKSFCKNTWFFKMTYKDVHPEYTKEGKPTYYKYWKDDLFFD